MNLMLGWPIWLVLVCCAIVAQLLKLLAYSVARRQFTPSVLAQSYGLPSFPSAVLSCLLVLTLIRSGWSSSESGFALVFLVIAIHDTVRVRKAASDQRHVVFHFVESMQEAGPFRQRVADYLDARTHHPVHVVVGVLYGSFFALAFGLKAG